MKFTTNANAQHRATVDVQVTGILFDRLLQQIPKGNAGTVSQSAGFISL